MTLSARRAKEIPVFNLVFWAAKNAYEIPEVKALEKASGISVVVHGPAVKLISSGRKPINAGEGTGGDKFQETLRQMKKATTLR